LSAIVERLLTWARAAPVSLRAQAADALARAYLVSDFTPQEREDAEAAMTVLLDDPAPDVRRALAEVLAPNERAPHHIVLALAGDQSSIAAIVAEQSPLILDCELVDLLGTRDEKIQIAIARRPYVSRAVSAALCEVGTAEACLTLLGNGGARLPRFSLARAVERHGDHPELRLCLLERPDLPLELRQRLLARLTAALQDLVVGRHWLPPERAARALRQAGERAMITASFEAHADDVPALVVRLMGAGELTPAFLIHAAASGQSLLFETALAMLANVPQGRVRALVASGRAANLAALLQKAGLPLRTHAAFQAAVGVIRRGDAERSPGSDYRRATRLIDAIVENYGRRPDRELDQILALLRRLATESKRSAARDFAHQVLEAA
jgi:uncharacterized protein (DUF2336 family)